MEPEVLISIVIPVKNGDNWLSETIPAILEQQVDGKIEIIAMDSGSTDNSLSILDSFKVRIIKIKPEDFNHGLTRNLGAQYAQGKYAVMTVQDAKPLSPFWLKELMSGFVDETVAGVCGQQIVQHDLNKNPAEWYRPISKPELRKYQFSNKNEFQKLTPGEQLSICRWDDVNAMYRRDYLMNLPFQKTDFAEDVLWARDALLAGYSIVYNPVAQVAHYHHENYQYAFKRNFIVQYHFYKYFGVKPIVKKGIKRYLSIIKLLIKEKKISLLDKLKWIKYNHQSLQAINKSNELILESLSHGDDAELDKLYRKTNQTIPQALNSNSF
jgi:rhamnosyltransferase